LSKSFLEGEFVDQFIQLYPRIKTITIELSAGSSMLFAAVEGLPEKIPLGLASGGMSKLAAILLGMTVHSGGLVLIDEIENGFYHQRLPSIWDALLKFSRQYDCQVFASTHSAECLNAVARLAETSPEEFCLMRTVLESDGTKVRAFSGERFSDAILANIEVR
jgi:AAA15 family ATPase/GTPase